MLDFAANLVSFLPSTFPRALRDGRATPSPALHAQMNCPWTMDALQVIHFLPNFKGDITGVVPQFGGKCIDITLRTRRLPKD